MKNLAAMDTEKLDTLPKKRGFHRNDHEKGCRCSWCYARHHSDFPDKRAYRWLQSKVGEKWAHVTSLWVHADWLKPMYREYHKLTELVETHTFYEDGKIAYFDKRSWRWDFNRAVEGTGLIIEDMQQEIFYVHPDTKVLCWKKKEPKAAYRERRALEEAKTFRIIGDYLQVLKLKGIWYLVWADTNSPHIKHVGPHQRLIHEDVSGQQHNFKSGWYCRTFDFRPWMYPKVYKRQLSRAELKQYGLTNEIRSL